MAEATVLRYPGTSGHETGTERFEELYRAHGTDVYHTCLGILRNPDDAAEATQEVFLRAIAHVDELEQPLHWLRRVARNYCLDQLRRHHYPTVDPASVPEQATTSSAGDPERQVMLRGAIASAFSRLSLRQRRALEHHLVMDEPVQGVASRLGLSYTAAAQVLSRARRHAAVAAHGFIAAAVALAVRASTAHHHASAAVSRGTRWLADGRRPWSGPAQGLVVAGVAVAFLGGSPLTSLGSTAGMNLDRSVAGANGVHVVGRAAGGHNAGTAGRVAAPPAQVSTHSHRSTPSQASIAASPDTVNVKVTTVPGTQQNCRDTTVDASEKGQTLVHRTASVCTPGS